MEGSHEAQQNRLIEQQMAADMEKDALTIKLLLLGAGDSGKTTLRKQMRNLFGTGFTKEMKQEFIPVILNLLVSGFEDVLEAMQAQLKLDLVNPNSAAAAAKILELARTQQKLVALDEAQVATMQTLLTDATFRQAVARKNEFQLQDCWGTFADEVRTYPAWGGPGWLPSVEDCVACRVRTTGIQEESFMLDNVPFRVFDVGGQRAERRKWIHCFDNVTAVIFVAAISEYDQMLFEDRKKNRLEEALELFEEVCNLPVFEKIDMILFLNKRDLFEKKYIVQGVPLDPVKFPGAPVHDVKACLAFIEKLFMNRNQKKKKIHVHTTTATSPDNIKHVFDACKNIILNASMMASGFRD
jgi:guanine nucleotide-binding protein G(i) subunit alpha